MNNKRQIEIIWEIKAIKNRLLEDISTWEMLMLDKRLERLANEYYEIGGLSGVR